MLVFSDVRKAYRNLEVLKGLTLSVPRGSLFGLMGQNGAGKTTLLRIAAGLLAPDSGELLVGGIDVRQRPEEAKRLIGFVPDGFGAYDNMSVLEYMSFFASGSAAATRAFGTRNFCGASASLSGGTVWSRNFRRACSSDSRWHAP